MLLPHVPEAPTNIVESASLNIPPSCFGWLGPIIYQVLLVDITCSVRFLGLWPRLPRGGWLALVTYQSQPSLEMVAVCNYMTVNCVSSSLVCAGSAVACRRSLSACRCSKSFLV